MATKTTDDNRPKTLPLVGRLRWTQIQPFLPVCRETWRTMCREGRAPRPIRLSPRCTVWDASEVLAWISDPVNYRADQSEEQAA